MKKIILIVLVLGSLISCSKYEDGPLLSLRSKEKRLVGTWKHVVNDNVYKTWNFEENKVFNELHYFDEVPRIPLDGEWEFSDKKDKINILNYYGQSDDGLSLELTTTTYTILRLTKDDLWLEGEETIKYEKVE